eukprot:scaffold6163_cov160-Skeletonema_marinoi.AAC.2
MPYEKYFNKWFGSKPLTKRWKMEPKPYKVEIRMLKKNELDEYCDVHLYDPDYKKNEVCKNITDDTILDVVVGKISLGCALETDCDPSGTDICSCNNEFYRPGTFYVGTLPPRTQWLLLK